MTSQIRRVGLVLPAATLVLAVAPTTGAHADAPPVDAPVSGASVSDASVSAALADAPATGPVRVVTIVDEAGHPRVLTQTAADRSAAASLVRAAQASSDVVSVGVDTRMRVLDAATGPLRPLFGAALREMGSTAASRPASADTYRSYQWALDRLKAEDAWVTSRGAGVTVAVVDSGVQAAHEDLAGAVLPGAACTAAGCTTTAGQNGSTDVNGHGTLVAGIIAAVAGNHIGVAGLAPRAKILPVRVMGADGGGDEGSVAAGVIWATDHGAKVINLSLGAPGTVSALAAAVRYAQAHDVAVVAAAGNSGESCSTGPADECGNPVMYPAALPGVTAVGATKIDDSHAIFSETGSYVDLSAPGTDVVSTYPLAFAVKIPGNDIPYAGGDGTSFSSPYAAATVALVRAAYPALSAVQAAAYVTATASDLGARGRDNVFGAGLVNPVAALRAPRPVTLQVGASAAQVRYGARAVLTATARISGTVAAGVRVVFRGTTLDGLHTSSVSATTGADGRARATMVGRAGTTWVATYTSVIGTRVSTRPVTVRVAPTVTARAATHAVAVKATGPTGRAMTLQRLVHGKWATVKSVHPRTASVTFGHLPRGTYRARLAGNRVLATAVSKAVSVR